MKKENKTKERNKERNGALINEKDLHVKDNPTAKIMVL